MLPGNIPLSISVHFGLIYLAFKLQTLRTQSKISASTNPYKFAILTFAPQEQLIQWLGDDERLSETT